MTSSETIRSARAAAIRYHYDVGNDFYRLWLDRTLSYSCAMPSGPGESLDQAQERKLQAHLDAIDVRRASRVLDVGCGWGAVLARAASYPTVTEAVGLTLSAEQAAYIQGIRGAKTAVHVVDWRDYRPEREFDGVISIGAFEHFARPDQTVEEKRAAYRAFFECCREWLMDGGALSLQTIAYANMSPADANGFMQREIFPDAELPTLADIVAAAEGLFEIERLENGRLDYAWTCAQWADRLRRTRREAIELVGTETVEKYLRYLLMSSVGFRAGKICLLRMVLRPYRVGHAVAGADR
ncbi:cyclopropane-fatty-acyl-phospholipid synthase [Tsukamurella sp. 8F]|uniref:SAM-dependent methyltransferase n=1 Tax=unclassified Tsukamurella TaxID=2633480 RepID=UPI0023B9D3AC|nr:MULTISPECIES: cyclopropane-fatty-acyl-phospholipid synthase family protein [unclassified Tsukamurella]MDF0529494.1 cyclopropane-fatty-acyl-phospholipid synthase [Tsukamurella sp. 8J]MDF0585818.1 cyclopropane-fatty-acyl-phospholipid synthase [Tsukamurella sp. 8F]